MKNLILLFSLICLTSTTACYVQANPSEDKADCKSMIIKTNRVIGHAHMSVKRGGIYTGDLSKAVRHERAAILLYKEGNFQKALFHSGRARKYAMEVIKTNKVKPPLEGTFTATEIQQLSLLPSDEVLDEEVAKIVPYEIKDQDLANGKLEIDFKE
jgi:hypothetical protein